VNNLPSLLRNRSQSDEWAGCRDADFLLEFPLGGFEQIFTRLDLALGNRPSAVVLVLEIRTTGMS
jgi:hypothetical protein